MNTCFIHGKYLGSSCEKCKQSYSDSKIEKDPNFILMILKYSLIMSLGIALGWFIFTLWQIN